MSLTQNTPPNHSSLKVHRSQQDTLTVNAHTTSCRMFPWELWRSVDHNMKPITAVTLLFSVNSIQTHWCSRLLSAANHLTTGLGVDMCTTRAADTWWTQRRTPKVRYVEGGPSQRRPAPAPRTQHHPKPHSPPLLPRVHQSRTSALSWSLS